MAKFDRKVARIFGETAGSNQRAEIGSLAAGTPTFTTDVETMQSLSNYANGWFDCVLGLNSPAIEDMNALCFVITYQIAYLMQTGVAEWNTDTVYYSGSLANDGYGSLYVSTSDGGSPAPALSDPNYWQRFFFSPKLTNAGASPYGLAPLAYGNIVEVDTSANSASMQIQLPAVLPNYGFQFSVMDVGGLASVRPIQILQGGTEKIGGLAATFNCEADYGFWNFNFDGTNWQVY
jgi:hypothetical protein